MGQFQNFKNDAARIAEIYGLTLPTKQQHYNRNANHSVQQAQISYYEVITARTNSGELKYKMLSDDASYFHRFEYVSGPEGTSGWKSVGDQSKWVSVTTEEEEYVFDYAGSKKLGQFAMLTDDDQLAWSDPLFELSHRNLGTYNFHPSTDAIPHTILDIYPWILWGNTPEDNSSDWTARDRWIESAKGLGVKGKAFVSNWIGTISEDTEIAKPAKKLPGNAAANTFSGSSDKEIFQGRGGVDTVSYASADSAVAVSLERDPRQDYQGLDGWARGDWFVSIENLVGSDWGDILVGDDNDNMLTGGKGTDILVGRAGNDTLIGGEGPDTLRGGDGDDTLVLHDAQDTVHGGKGLDTAEIWFDNLFVGSLDGSGAEIYRLTDDGVFAVDVLRLNGSDAGEILVGNRFDNDIQGNGGADVLAGGRGRDTLYGGKGNDIYDFVGQWDAAFVYDEGGRNDALRILDRNYDDLRLVREISDASDTLSIFDTTTGDTIFVTRQFKYGTSAVEELLLADTTVDLRKGLTFTGADDEDRPDALAGTRFGDTIIAQAGDDHIYAGRGADIIT
ncbi:MAG: calcium-binding protein, partial [Pseudomonadota bacterium]|nr:calcium-binding protein [Pseudomonadota bacterium]